jgi:hypothetical protein
MRFIVYEVGKAEIGLCSYACRILAQPLSHKADHISTRCSRHVV